MADPTIPTRLGSIIYLPPLDQSGMGIYIARIEGENGDTTWGDVYSETETSHDFEDFANADLSLTPTVFWEAPELNLSAEWTPGVPSAKELTGSPGSIVEVRYETSEGSEIMRVHTLPTHAIDDPTIYLSEDAVSHPDNGLRMVGPVPVIMPYRDHWYSVYQAIKSEEGKVSHRFILDGYAEKPAHLTQ